MMNAAETSTQSRHVARDLVSRCISLPIMLFIHHIYRSAPPALRTTATMTTAKRPRCITPLLLDTLCIAMPPDLLKHRAEKPQRLTKDTVPALSIEQELELMQAAFRAHAPPPPQLPAESLCGTASVSSCVSVSGACGAPVAAEEESSAELFSDDGTSVEDEDSYDSRCDKPLAPQCAITATSPPVAWISDCRPTKRRRCE